MSASGAGDVETFGLTWADTGGPGFGRRRAGRGFRYLAENGAALTDAGAVARIRRLAIPPAWRQVWICPSAQGHIQAIGLDERGRRQYLYHPAFREAQDDAKFDGLIAFGEALPRLRAQVQADLSRPGLPREKVLATVVSLLETTLIRVGNIEYAKANNSFGLTTLLNRHVLVDGAELRFSFAGKSGRKWRLGVRDRRVANIVRRCQDLPGQRLFEYRDEAGEIHAIASADVNAYLKAASGAEITAKNFRTWAGTVLAAEALVALPSPESAAAGRRALSEMFRAVGNRLGNTPTICRKGYVHPGVVEAWLAGRLVLKSSRRPADGMSSLEAAVLAFLKRR
jgi:DNA topoisomerase-1